MNKRLLEALQDGLSPEKREEITKLVALSGAADSELVQAITEVEMAKVMNIAAGYISRACGMLAQRDQSFETYAVATELVNGLEIIMKSPAVINYTQAVILLTVALLTGQEEGED